MQDGLGGSQDFCVNLLSLDGGHTGETGAISQLMTLQEIMRRHDYDVGNVNLRPCDVFEMICGSGTGGLIAILLGRLEMTVKEAIDAYINLFPAVFTEAEGKGSCEKDKSQQLEEGLESLVSSRSTPENSLQELMPQKTTKCKVFVSAMDSNNLAFPVLFRSYRVRSNASYNCSVKEAARATTAIPGEYSPTFIGDTIKQSYIAASHGYNNPTELLLREVKDIFPNQSVSCIVNIGTGHPGTTQITSSDALTDAVLRISRDCERVSQDITARFADFQDFYFRLNVEQGMQWRLPTDSKSMSEVAAHTRSYLAKAQVDKTVNTLVDVLCEPKGKINTRSFGSVILPTKYVRKVCPPPSANFTGREKELAQIHAYVSSAHGRRIVVLHGLGGSGKTQVCAKFVEESQQKDPPCFSEVFFVDGGSVENEFESIAREKKVGESAAEALDWFTRQTSNWLIVFDNVDDKSIDLPHYIPRCSFGNAIITTRNPDLAELTSTEASLHIGDLKENHATLLLLRAARYPSSDKFLKEATTIVKELHCFALAITQAGAYIANSCSLQDYLNVYRVHRSELLQTRHGQDPDMYNESVYTTWSLSIQKLSPLSRQLLQLCSFLHHNGIQRRIFQNAIENPPDEDISDPENSARSFLQNFMLNNSAWSLSKFLAIAKEAQAYSLLHYDHLNDCYTIHPLVHTWCQTLPGNDNSIRCMVTILALSIDLEKGVEARSIRMSLLPHLDSIRLHVEVPADEAAMRFAQVYRDTGHWKDCESLLLPVVESRQRELGEEHPDTLIGKNNLAWTMMELGRWEEAEQLQVSVLEAQKRLLGEDHPHTLSSMSNLALTFRNQGRWKEAEQLQVLVLDVMKRLFGEEHPDTLLSMNNLALTFSEQGRWKEAEQLQVLVLEANKRVLGEDHPHTLRSMVNLVGKFSEQERWKEAEQLQVSVLEATKRTAGEEHPDTLTSMNSLALTLHMQGRWKEAEQLQVSVLEARKRLLGEEHPGTLTSMYNLGTIFADQRRIEEAKELLADVVEKQKKVLGKEHPLTLRSILWLEHVNEQDSKETSADSSSRSLIWPKVKLKQITRKIAQAFKDRE